MIPPLKEYTRIRDRPEEGTIKSAPGKGVKIHLKEAPILCHSHDSPVRISVPGRCGGAEDGILKQRGRHFDPTPSDFSHVLSTTILHKKGILKSNLEKQVVGCLDGEGDCHRQREPLVDYSEAGTTEHTR